MIFDSLLEIDSLQERKNLLAFSGGVDSTALFFILQKLNIHFDLALVNYQTRASSDEEEAFAKELGEEFGVGVFTAKAPKFDRDFENRAREFRYHFFEEIIDRYHYQNLLTAHHLGDRLEWFFMKLIRGAGSVELLGMEQRATRFTREGREYNLIRPLLNLSKDELLEFLDSNGYRYFIDSSNFDTKFERNYIRAEFANPLIKNYKDGIKRSFEYLERDREYLRECFELKKRVEKLAIFQLRSIECIDRAVSSYLREFGVRVTAKERAILKREKSIIISREWVAVLRGDDTLFIAPFVQISMPKRFKEECRVAKIPPKIRPYLYREGVSLKIVQFN